MTTPLLEYQIQVPKHVTALCWSPSGDLCLGSEDGSARVYHPPENKVVKAIRGLGDEVSSIAWGKAGKEDASGHIFVAAGCQVMSFDLSLAKLVLSASDASHTFDLGEDPEDVLNEVMLHPNGKYLAFSTDSGTVGIIELSTKKITRMKTRHTSLCGTVKFIPDRPSELVSGGYDSALLHFDFNQGTILSRHDFTAPAQSSGISLSPPFVLSSAISSTALLAAGTADGRLWLGSGGEKLPGAGAKKKRSRKWEGLKPEGALEIKIAEGPVVAVEFFDPTKLLTCTLLGTITFHSIRRDENQDIGVETIWTAQTKSIAKVNAMGVRAGWISVGGFDKDGQGLVEMWRVGVEGSTPTQPPPT